MVHDVLEVQYDMWVYERGPYPMASTGTYTAFLSNVSLDDVEQVLNQIVHIPSESFIVVDTDNIKKHPSNTIVYNAQAGI